MFHPIGMDFIFAFEIVCFSLTLFLLLFLFVYLWNPSTAYFFFVQFNSVYKISICMHWMLYPTYTQLIADCWCQQFFFLCTTTFCIRLCVFVYKNQSVGCVNCIQMRVLFWNLEIQYKIHTLKLIISRYSRTSSNSSNNKYRVISFSQYKFVFTKVKFDHTKELYCYLCALCTVCVCSCAGRNIVVISSVVKFCRRNK